MNTYSILPRNAYKSDQMNYYNDKRSFLFKNHIPLYRQKLGLNLNIDSLGSKLTQSHSVSSYNLLKRNASQPTLLESDSFRSTRPYNHPCTCLYNEICNNCNQVNCRLHQCPSQHLIEEQMNINQCLNSELNEAKDKINKANETISHLNNINSNLNLHKDYLDKQVIEYEKLKLKSIEDNKQLEDKCNVNISKLERANDNILKINKENNDLKNEIKRLNDKIKEQSEIIESINNKNINLLNQIENQRKNYDEIIENNKKLNKENIDNKLAEIEYYRKSYLDNNLLVDQLQRDLQISEKNNTKCMQFRTETVKCLKDLFDFYNSILIVFNKGAKFEKLDHILNNYDNYKLKAKLSVLEEKIRKSYDNNTINQKNYLSGNTVKSNRASSVYSKKKKY